MEFLRAYEALYAEEEQFRPPSELIGGNFYKYVLPYHVFNTYIHRPTIVGENSSSLDKASSALAAYSSDLGRAKKLLLTAIDQVGIAETATELVRNATVVSHEELTALALSGAKQSRFFVWSEQTR